MTLIEFIAPIKDGSQSDKVLATLLHASIYEGLNQLSVSQIRDRLKTARVPRYAKINISDVLARSGHFVQSHGNGDWALTEKSGIPHVQKLLGLPKVDVEEDVTTLMLIAANISNTEIRNYVEEAITCLKVNARRASVVFIWTGAIRIIHNKMLAYGKNPLNAALKKHDPNARNVTQIDHFAYIKDKTTLIAAQELGLFDKTQKDTLVEALDLRNRCGHPGKYSPGEKKVSSFIEDLVSIVF